MRIQVRRRRRPWPAAGAVAVMLSVGPALATTASVRPAATAASGGEWTTYGGSLTRQSDQSASPVLTPLRSRWRSPTVDGQVFGEPLIYHGLVLVGTEADTVYALSASSGRVVWRRHLGRPVSPGSLPCGNISPAVGITSTMVIDPTTSTVYASGSTSSGSSIHHLLWALSVGSGALLWTRDLDRPGWSAGSQLQRTALALADGKVIVGFGGNFGDCGDYHGFVMASPESKLGSVAVYEVPTSREGAIWAPSGVSVGASGNVFAATGNGASNTTYDEGDSVIELTPSMQRVATFAPTNWAHDNEVDADLGSSAPVILPGNRIVILGKEEVAYLLDENHLGGIGGELASAPGCSSRGGDAWQAPLLLVACPDASMMAYRVGARSLQVAWRSSNAPGSPTIAGGIAWSVDGSGNLVGLSPATGRQLVSVHTVDTEHFAAPSAGEGLLVVGGSSQVQAFDGPKGLLG